VLAIRRRPPTPKERPAAEANEGFSQFPCPPSGAQWVSSDYPVENPAFGTSYAVQLGSPARYNPINPINAPAICRSGDLE